MPHFRTIFAFVLSAVLFAGIMSCSSNTGADESNFDRQAMLQNYGENIIIPAYNELQESVNTLHQSANTFAEAPTVENLDQLRDDLKQARLSWQDASIFQFGPAGMQTLRGAVNTYPADVDQIESNIESGDYTLGTIANQPAAGFPTVGYLIYGDDASDQEIIAQYTTDANADNRTTYLRDNADFIKQKTDAVVNGWKAEGDNYLSTFTSEENAGTDVGSSLGMLINSYVQHYEKFLRDGKIGIPAGVRSAGTPRPVAVEAYYGGYSTELAIANLRQVERIFTGDDGRGLDDNLEALGAGDLSDEIQTQIDEAQSELEGLNDPLSQQIEQNNDPVLTTFEEMQQVVSLIKADMTSILGVTITFQDTDGD